MLFTFPELGAKNIENSIFLFVILSQEKLCLVLFSLKVLLFLISCVIKQILLTDLQTLVL